jgi:hypothetical protein
LNHLSSTWADPFGLLVDAVYDSKSGVLTVTDRDTGASASAKSFTGLPGFTSDQSGGPLPNGQFTITDEPSGEHGGNWFALFAQDRSLDDKTFVNGNYRDGFRLHLGSFSLGCMTVDSREPTGPADWAAMKSLVDSTSTTDVGYHGANVIRSIKNYGTLVVK